MPSLDLMDYYSVNLKDHTQRYAKLQQNGHEYITWLLYYQQKMCWYFESSWAKQNQPGPVCKGQG